MGTGAAMLTRRAFASLGLGASLLGLLGLASCDGGAVPVELVAGEDLYYVAYSCGGGMDVDGMFTVDSNQDLTDMQRGGFRAAVTALESRRG